MQSVRVCVYVCAQKSHSDYMVRFQLAITSDQIDRRARRQMPSKMFQMFRCMAIIRKPINVPYYTTTDEIKLLYDRERLSVKHVGLGLSTCTN